MSLNDEGIRAVLGFIANDIRDKLSPIHLHELDKILANIKNYLCNQSTREEFLKQISSLGISLDAIKIVDDIKSNDKSQVCDINMIDKDEQTKNRRKNRKPWSNYEDMRLLIGIMRFGINNWKSISLFLGNNRSSSQCSQRWNRSLNPCISKNIWSTEENFQLLNLVQQYGERAWSKISKIMQNRSDIQCQYHYKQIKGKIAYHSLDQNSISN